MSRCTCGSDCGLNCACGCDCFTVKPNRCTCGPDCGLNCTCGCDCYSNEKVMKCTCGVDCSPNCSCGCECHGSRIPVTTETVIKSCCSETNVKKNNYYPANVIQSWDNNDTVIGSDRYRNIAVDLIQEIKLKLSQNISEENIFNSLRGFFSPLTIQDIYLLKLSLSKIKEESLLEKSCKGKEIVVDATGEMKTFIDDIKVASYSNTDVISNTIIGVKHVILQLEQQLKEANDKLSALEYIQSTNSSNIDAMKVLKKVLNYEEDLRD